MNCAQSNKTATAAETYTAFDHRIVRYEQIHSIKAEDFHDLVKLANIGFKCRLLDCGCGYGAVVREVLRESKSLLCSPELDLEIDLIDESSVQLERAKEELQSWLQMPGVRLRFIRGVFPSALEPCMNVYDVVTCKMVLHEISKSGQPMFIDSMYECLKKRGRCVLWDVCLSPDIADFYRSVIRAKDDLAGFDTMVLRRNFLTEEDIRNLFRHSAFGRVQFVKDIAYRFHTHNRLFPEFRGNVDRFKQWNETIRRLRTALTASSVLALGYRDDGEDISFDVRKVIFLAVK